MVVVGGDCLRGHPHNYVTLRGVRKEGVWRSVTEYYENSDKSVTGVGGWGWGGKDFLKNGQIGMT